MQKVIMHANLSQHSMWYFNWIYNVQSLRAMSLGLVLSRLSPSYFQIPDPRLM
jgi:hypothetical protein